MEISQEHLDRILFIHSDLSHDWSKFYNAFENQNKNLTSYRVAEINQIPHSPFDLIIVCLTDNSDDLLETLIELKKQVSDPGQPYILIAPEFTESLKAECQSIISEFKCVEIHEPISKVLVSATLLLRLRKMRSEHIKSQVDVVSENASLRDLNNRFNKDINEAREIHERLLPSHLPEFSSMNCASYYLPLEVVGGDLFDMWKIDENSIGIFLGDITGHGLPAAFIAAMTKMCISLAPEKTPAKVLSFLNKNLSNYLPDGRFITAVCAAINSESKILTYSNAGHPPLLQFSFSDSKVYSLTERGMPINIDADLHYTENSVDIKAGDKILFYSDGFYETQNMSNQIMGIEKLIEMFEKFSINLPINEILTSLVEFQDNFGRGRIMKDDVTILGVEIL